jgi:hypothetical protein
LCSARISQPEGLWRRVNVRPALERVRLRHASVPRKQSSILFDRTRLLVKVGTNRPD